MTNLSLEAGGEDIPKNDTKKKLIDDVLRFLEDKVCLKTSIKIGRSVLNISTWSRLLQVNFVMRFLGPGFVKHMQENQHISTENQPLPNMFTCDYEEMKKKSPCPNPALKKAKNLVRKQKRSISQTRNAGHMAVGLEGEDLKE
ncbi:hypothetical protein MKX01_023606 [Papaver californicum]|nr:hypothetical protein MKX01_023606 [Papaver californicum]